MALSKEAAIKLARELKAEEPDLTIVRPIPVGDNNIYTPTHPYT